MVHDSVTAQGPTQRRLVMSRFRWETIAGENRITLNTQVHYLDQRLVKRRNVTETRDLAAGDRHSAFEEMSSHRDAATTYVERSTSGFDGTQGLANHRHQREARISGAGSKARFSRGESGLALSRVGAN